MSGVDGTGQDKAPRRTRLRVMLLVVWVVTGWGSALLAAPPLRDWLVEYRSRTTGPSYGLAHDAASAVAAELGTRDRAAELLGTPAAGLDETKLCRLTWMDREKTYVHAQRPSRARPAYALLGVTAAGRAALGLYAVDLWSGNCAESPTEFYDRDCTKVGQVRLVERRELSVAKAESETRTPTPLLAGQCVWRKLSGKAGVVGRFQVQLPAEREIAVRAFVLPPSAFLSYRLMFAGREAEHARGESTVFQSLGEGDYELEVALQPATDGRETPGEYTLQVHWGQGAGEACPVPSFDERECYGVETGKGGGE